MMKQKLFCEENWPSSLRYKQVGGKFVHCDKRASSCSCCHPFLYLHSNTIMLSCRSFFRTQNAFQPIVHSYAFNPLAPPPACYEDFTTSIDCHYDLVVHPVLVTPQRIQARLFTSTSSDLLLIISNWESGEGDGGRENEGLCCVLLYSIN
jgi:hypothetical protein